MSAAVAARLDHTMCGCLNIGNARSAVVGRKGTHEILQFDRPQADVVRSSWREGPDDPPKMSMRAGDNPQARTYGATPHGKMPKIELDDGAFISEFSPSANISKTPAQPAMIGSPTERKRGAPVEAPSVDSKYAAPWPTGPLARASRSQESCIVHVPSVGRSQKDSAGPDSSGSTVSWQARNSSAQAPHDRGHRLCFLDLARRWSASGAKTNKNIVRRLRNEAAVAKA